MIVCGARSEMEMKAAAIVTDRLRTLLENQARAVVGVVGGRSIDRFFSRLEPMALDWQRVHFFMLDERLVPVDHPDSNFNQVVSAAAPLGQRENFHPFVFDSQRPQQALSDYQNQLSRYGGRFDIALLSSGEDGHVGSLFPNHETIRNAAEGFILTDSSPKPPAGRMSASRQLLESSGTALLFFFGTEKSSAYSAFRDEQATVEACPAKLVRAVDEHYILTDLTGDV